MLLLLWYWFFHGHLKTGLSFDFVSCFDRCISGFKGPRCVLCNKTIDKGDEAWSKHLKDDCAPNKARLQQQQASKAPSQASLRSSRGRGGKATTIARGAGKGRGRRRGAMPK